MPPAGGEASPLLAPGGSRRRTRDGVAGVPTARVESAGGPPAPSLLDSARRRVVLLHARAAVPVLGAAWGVEIPTSALWRGRRDRDTGGPGRIEVPHPVDDPPRARPPEVLATKRPDISMPPTPPALDLMSAPVFLPALSSLVSATAAAACPAGAPPRPEEAPRPAAQRPLVAAGAAAERCRGTGAPTARPAPGSGYPWR